MTSKIEIYNRALSRIGIDQFISDPNTNSKQGNLYRVWYDALVDQVLADFPWGFASTVIAAAQLDGDPPAGWQYKYAYPVDCLAARQITDAGGARTIWNTYLRTMWDGRNATFNPAKAGPPWKVMSESTGTASRRFIATDLPEAYLLYTRRVTDPNQFDQGFIDALSWRIAMEITPPFFGGPQGAQLAVTVGNQYRNALLTAHAQSVNESAPDYKPDPASIATRR